MLYDNGGKVIQSVQRAVDIINCFNDTQTELTLTHISQILDLNKSTVHGIISTLQKNGYIRQNNEGRYLLGQVLLSKYKYSRSTDKALLLVTAKPHMTQLSNKYKTTSYLLVVEEEKPIVLHTIMPTNSIYAISSMSKSDSLYCTASGKLVLANMSENSINNYLECTRLIPSSPFTITTIEELQKNLVEIRKNGYSYENQELVEGISAISFPIYDKNNFLFGAISATGISPNIIRNFDAIAADLKRASSSITKEMFR